MDQDELINRYLAATPHSRSEVLTRPSIIPATSGSTGGGFVACPLLSTSHGANARAI